MARVFGYDDVGNHAAMLVDRVRMRAFSEAIQRAVRRDDVVVDVGSGSGVLALLCARAGARRVFAVERGAMAPLIERAAQKNGVADVVRVVRADARDVGVTAFADERPTLIVSEMIGTFGLDEDYLGLLGAVRAQCAPACRTLPESVAVELAVAYLPELQHEIDTVRSGLGVGVQLDDVATALQSRVVLTWVDGEQLVSSSTTPSRFSVGDRPPKVLGGHVTIEAHDAHSVNAIVGWFDARLFGDVTLTSHPAKARTHWAHLVLPLHPPLQVRHGDVVDLEVRPRLLVERGTYSWSARRRARAAAAPESGESGASGEAGEKRSGDGMRSLVGDRDDVLRQLGLSVRPDEHDRALASGDDDRLQRWAAILGGDVAAMPVLVQRLRAAYPTRYADDADAENEVLQLLYAAERR